MYLTLVSKRLSLALLMAALSAAAPLVAEIERAREWGGQHELLPRRFDEERAAYLSHLWEDDSENFNLLWDHEMARWSYIPPVAEDGIQEGEGPFNYDNMTDFFSPRENDFE